ncbi:hypothetical protein Vi05172_g634 [Venturia inaequalis]|nr:hypothetical protein Vi05172_g634 [Venturia inaequalis]
MLGTSNTASLQPGSPNLKALGTAREDLDDEGGRNAFGGSWGAASSFNNRRLFKPYVKPYGREGSPWRAIFKS